MKLDRRAFLASSAAGLAAASRPLKVSADDDPLGVRKDFPAATNCTYLNTPFISPPPRSVEEAGVAFLRAKTTARRTHGSMFETTDEARGLFASLFGAKTEEVAFLFTTSEGENIVAAEFRLHETARKYEYATVTFGSLYQLVAGLKYLTDVGLESIEAHTVGLASYMRAGLVDQGLKVRTPEGNASAIVSFYHGADPKAARSLFEKENIAVGFRENGTGIRAGAALFNTKSDIDHLLATTKTLAPA